MENSKADFKRDFDKEAFINFIKLSNITPAIDHKFLLENLDCMLENGKMTNAGVLFFTKLKIYGGRKFLRYRILRSGKPLLMLFVIGIILKKVPV